MRSKLQPTMAVFLLFIIHKWLWGLVSLNPASPKIENKIGELIDETRKWVNLYLHSEKLLVRAKLIYKIAATREQIFENMDKAINVDSKNLQLAKYKAHRSAMLIEKISKRLKQNENETIESRGKILDLIINIFDSRYLNVPPRDVFMMPEVYEYIIATKDFEQYCNSNDKSYRYLWYDLKVRRDNAIDAFFAEARKVVKSFYGF